MSLQFSFGAANPLPLVPDGAAGAPATTSSVLDLRVTIEGGAPATVVCEGISGDGVSYARAEKAVQDPDSPAGLAAAARSALARAGAELPEPLIESVTGVVLSLGGIEREVLAELGLNIDADADPVARVDDALQARTGIAAGTPIRVA